MSICMHGIPIGKSQIYNQNIIKKSLTKAAKQKLSFWES